MRIKTKTVGLDRWQRKLSRYPKQSLQAIARALYQEAEFTITEAKEIVPVDTGALKNSGFVETPVIAPRRIVIRLGFGGVAGAGNGASNTKDVGYAVYVHENCGAHHDHGQCKYLEIPLQRAIKNIPRAIDREVDKLHWTMRWRSR